MRPVSVRVSTSINDRATAPRRRRSWIGSRPGRAHVAGHIGQRRPDPQRVRGCCPGTRGARNVAAPDRSRRRSPGCWAAAHRAPRPRVDPATGAAVGQWPAADGCSRCATTCSTAGSGPIPPPRYRGSLSATSWSWKTGRSPSLHHHGLIDVVLPDHQGPGRDHPEHRVADQLLGIHTGVPESVRQGEQRGAEHLLDVFLFADHPAQRVVHLVRGQQRTHAGAGAHLRVPAQPVGDRRQIYRYVRRRVGYTHPSSDGRWWLLMSVRRAGRPTRHRGGPRPARCAPGHPATEGHPDPGGAPPPAIRRPAPSA